MMNIPIWKEKMIKPKPRKSPLPPHLSILPCPSDNTKNGWAADQALRQALLLHTGFVIAFLQLSMAQSGLLAHLPCLSPSTEPTDKQEEDRRFFNHHFSPLHSHFPSFYSTSFSRVKIHTPPVLGLTLLIPFVLLIFWSWARAEKAERLGAGVLKEKLMS